MEEGKQYLSSSELSKLLIKQEQLVNEKMRIDILKLQSENIKMNQRIQELEAEKIGWSHSKHIERIRDAKDKFKTKREAYEGLLKTLSAKYKADLKYGFNDETGEILTKEDI